MSMDELNQDDQIIFKLKQACSDLNNLLQHSFNVETNLAEIEERFVGMQEKLSIASRRIAPLQSLSIANKALDTKINRAISPALALLESFKLSDSLQRKLLELASKLANEKSFNKRVEKLIKYVDTVDDLNEAINSISRECEPAIQKLQEVVEFLSRTKATDQFRTHRLRETLITLKALCENEVDAMRFDGLLDDALLNLQDEYESLLNKMRHRNFMEAKSDYDDDHQDDVDADTVSTDLGSQLEIELLSRISETLAANDCLDLCIDIFVKVRYKRAAKALMTLNPEYLKTYSPEEIDEMEWESLETVISLWIQHFELAIKNVFVSEKKLCCQVLGTIMDGVIWPECFVKIADKIMAVFFRFGEGVARSKKEPQKLFKLLDMFESLEKLKPEFSEIFSGEAGADICLRYRELEKLLVHSYGSVPKLVRYAINYLKYLLTDAYSTTMVRILRTEQIWKSGILSTPETEENLLKDAIFNIMDAIRRNVESKRLRYKDKVLPHVFVMNTYWYIYMRTRSTELGKLMGDQYMKKTYKIVTEESAYSYQKQAWGPLVKLLDGEELKRVDKDGLTAMVRGKMDAFTKGFDNITQRHKKIYHIPDADLREQMREATVKLVVPVYTEFLNNFASSLHVKSYVSPEYIEDSLNQMFEVAHDHKSSGKSSLGPRQMRDLSDGSKSLSGEQSRRSKDFRRSKSSAIDT
ncbi:unnamed protein product [Withania somnifera]